MWITPSHKVLPLSYQILDWACVGGRERRAVPLHICVMGDEHLEYNGKMLIVLLIIVFQDGGYQRERCASRGMRADDAGLFASDFWCRLSSTSTE